MVVEVHKRQKLQSIFDDTESWGTIILREAHRRREVYGVDDYRTLRLMGLLQLFGFTKMPTSQSHESQSIKTSLEVIVGGDVQPGIAQFEKALQQENFLQALVPGNLGFLLLGPIILDPLHAALDKIATMVLKAIGSFSFVVLWPVGMYYERIGKIDEAEKLYRAAIKKAKKILGKCNELVVEMVEYFCGFLCENKKYSKAVIFAKEVFIDLNEVLGEAHLSTVRISYAIARGLAGSGNHEEAIEWYRRTLSGQEKSLGPEHPDKLITIHNMGVALYEKGNYEEALTWCRRALTRREKILGPEHPKTRNSLRGLINVYEALGQANTATELRSRLN